MKMIDGRIQEVEVMVDADGEEVDGSPEDDDPETVKLME
jgi:hypothetical protein